MCGTATLILPDLWLGDLADAYNYNFLNAAQISLVINCTYKYPNYFPDDIIYHRVPIENAYVCKTSVNTLMLAINNTINQINNSLNHEKPVFVHCRRGHHRSAVIVAAYLIKFYRFTVIEAIDFIKTKRPCTFRERKCIVQTLIPFYHYVHNS